MNAMCKERNVKPNCYFQVQAGILGDFIGMWAYLKKFHFEESDTSNLHYIS